MDTVRAGPVPVRAGLWTGRRRSGPDPTEQCLGPVCRDRTGNGGPRAGPRGPSGPAKTWAERALELRRELFIGDAMLEEAQLVEKMSGSFRRTSGSYMTKKNTGGSSSVTNLARRPVNGDKRDDGRCGDVGPPRSISLAGTTDPSVARLMDIVFGAIESSGRADDGPVAVDVDNGGFLRPRHA